MTDYLREELQAIATRHGLEGAAVEALHVALAGAEGGQEELVPPRYVDHGRLGVGGTGEVRRVWDERMRRFVAMKRLRRGGDEARFVDEVRRTAGLSHPGVAPVHDLARDADGTLFYTLREVRGVTLDVPIRAVHAASTSSRWGTAPDGTTLWDLVDWLGQVCDVVGHAHVHGVVHRDLKPENLMIGARGEVWVLDWGLSRGGEPGGIERGRTRIGAVAGTPAYMPPEQAGGAFDRLGPRADVYSLGATLFEILAGRPPFSEAADVVRAVLAGPPAMPASPPVPTDLTAVLARAMDRVPEGRHTDANALASDLRAWLQGERRRERGRALHDRAVAERERAAALRAQAQANADRLDELEHAAQVAEADHEQLLHEALARAPDLVPARVALLDALRRSHDTALARADPVGTATAEAAIRAHAHALPSDHPVRARHVAWLRGDGALTLVTEPPGATATLYRYVLRNRRLVPIRDRALGTTPLVRVTLEQGSWLVVLTHPGRADVRYPVRIHRQEHWHGIPPGGSDPAPIRLPTPDELGPHDVYVPAGTFEAGGDPLAYISLDAVSVWWPGFVVRRFPVSVAEYLVFLSDLRAAGDDWEELVPHLVRRGSQPSPPLMVPTPDGFRVADRVPAEVRLGPDYPIVGVDLRCALRYGRWLATRSGRPWRLLAELEWEKAARGVDGRPFPWGSWLDPGWCRIRATEPGVLRAAAMAEYPEDVSPYGVRHLAGNVREWTLDVHRPESDARRPGLVAPPAAWDGGDPGGLGRFGRGGTFGGNDRMARCASRNAYPFSTRDVAGGFRLGRTL